VELDAPKEWWEDEQIFRPISEWTLQKNEWLDLDQAPETCPPYVPQIYDEIAVRGDQLNSDETDEEFDWFDAEQMTNDTFFCFVNKNRRTIETGEQVFYCYGNRTNKFLLLNYGFSFPGNKYDSFEFPLRLDVPVDDLFAPEIVDLEWKSRLMQPVRLKKDQICEVVVSFLRSACKKSFFITNKSAQLKPGKRILLTRPVNLFYERYVFSYYLQIVSYVSDQLALVSTLEQDEELLKRGEPGSTEPAISFELRMAVVYRLEKKKILRSQINLVKKVLEVLKNAEAVLLNPQESEPSRAY